MRSLRAEASWSADTPFIEITELRGVPVYAMTPEGWRVYG